MPTDPISEPDPDDPGKFGIDPHVDHEPVWLDPDDPGPFALDEDTTSDTTQPTREYDSAWQQTSL